MKRIIFIVSFALLFCSCYHQERDCNNFHTGTFEFETFLNGTLEKTRFVRNDSIEIDYFKNKSDTATIRWINDCEYIVEKLHPKNMALQINNEEQ